MEQDFIQALIDSLELERKDINLNDSFREFEEWSSLSVILLIAMYDELYNKEITDKDIKQCNTINDLYLLIQ